MNFTSPLFLFGFLPVTIALYYGALLCDRVRSRNIDATPTLSNYALLLASLVFYFVSAPTATLVLLAGCCVDLVVARHCYGRQSPRLLALGIFLALAVLIYFKYLGFIGENLTAVLRGIGFDPWDLPYPILIAGVSFFTFHRISFLVDIYRGDAELPRSLSDYLLYILLFPHMIAGPIVRFKEIALQLVVRRHSVDGFAQGVQRFTWGLAKKVLIADTLALYVDEIFRAPQLDYSPTTTWLALLCYALQIYFDFSGYSEMAIGLAQLFGLTFPENFNAPYLARSITEFWRRWHMTLSHWMRDYLYIPIGGNRVAPFRAYLNLWAVFLASGIWHGASWNFVLWGATHGTMISVEKIVPLGRAGRPLTLLVLLLSWVFFRTETFADALAIFRSLLSPGGVSIPMLSSVAWCLALGVLLCAIEPIVGIRLHRKVRPATTLLLLILSIAHIFAFEFRPFIYFRF